MEINKKNLLFAAALVVLIIALGKNAGKKEELANNDQQGDKTQNAAIVSENITPPVAPSAGPNATTLSQQDILPRGEPPARPNGTVAGASDEARFDPHKGMSFQEAMDNFRNGYRFQFTNCRGTPGHYTVTTQTRFMLDNRDGMRHDFKVASITFTIPAYDFLITGTKEVGTHMITCDGGGAAELTVVE